jgi:hypothetical protein
MEQSYFYALSWMIQELGNLKDSGLHIIAIKEALQQTSTIADEAAFKKTYQMLNAKQPTLETLLDKAGKLAQTYFKEQNLEHLVVGAVKTKSIKKSPN